MNSLTNYRFLFHFLFGPFSFLVCDFCLTKRVAHHQEINMILVLHKIAMDMRCQTFPLGPRSNSLAMFGVVRTWSCLHFSAWWVTHHAGDQLAWYDVIWRELLSGKEIQSTRSFVKMTDLANPVPCNENGLLFSWRAPRYLWPIKELAQLKLGIIPGPLSSSSCMQHINLLLPADRGQFLFCQKMLLAVFLK